eukprot:1453661-Rhodomonas_salina.2
MQWVPNLGYPSLSEKKHEASSKSSVGNADSKNIRPASASPTPKMATAAQYASMGARLSVKPTPLRAPKSMCAADPSNSFDCQVLLVCRVWHLNMCGLAGTNAESALPYNLRPGQSSIHVACLALHCGKKHLNGQ